LLVLVLIIPLVFVIANRLRMDVAALLMAAVLGILQLAGVGVLGPAGKPEAAIDAISGFSQPVVITLLALFVLTRSLESSGVTRWIAQKVIHVAGSNERLLIALFALITAIFSLFMNNLAAGALVLPSAMEVARRTGTRPSKLLIPVAYGSLLGGSATYFTTANIISSGLLTIANPPQKSLNFLDFTPTGGLILLAGILFLYFWGSRLLPSREPTDEQAAARFTGSELEDLYQLSERLWLAKPGMNSPLVGQTLAEACIGSSVGVVVAAVRTRRGDLELPLGDHKISSVDELVLVGRQEKIDLLRSGRLEISPAPAQFHLSTGGITFGEVLLAPRSRAVGQTLKALDFRNRYKLSVIALKRLDRSYRTDVADFVLSPGDSLLVVGDREHILALKRSPDFITLEPNPADQPLNVRSTVISVAVLAAAVGASIAGAPVYLCMLAAALVLILSQVVMMEEAYQAIEWQAVFLIAGMYAVSLAMVNTGLANALGQAVISVVRPMGGLGLAAGAYLLTGLLTQFMGGQVTALITAPITIAAAISMGVSPQAVAVATAIGCSATFLTPMAHPVNVLMIAPANYQFKDFFRIGWILTLICFAVLLVGLKVFWGL
jgi:di/tricarboxylate transporter